MSEPYYQVQPAKAPAQNGTLVLEFQALDQDDQPITASRTQTARLDLYNVTTRAAVISARDVLNANGGTIDALGNVRIILKDTDLAVSTGDTDRQFAYRRAVVTYTYTGPDGSPLPFPAIIDFPIRKVV